MKKITYWDYCDGEASKKDVVLLEEYTSYFDNEGNYDYEFLGVNGFIKTIDLDDDGTDEIGLEELPNEQQITTLLAEAGVLEILNKFCVVEVKVGLLRTWY